MTAIAKSAKDILQPKNVVAGKNLPYMVLYGPYGPAWSCVILYGPVWFHRVSYGSIWPCMVPYGLYGPVSYLMAPYGPVCRHQRYYIFLDNEYFIESIFFKK